MKEQDYERIWEHLKLVRSWWLGTDSGEVKPPKDWRLWRCQDSEGHVKIRNTDWFCRLLKKCHYQTLSRPHVETNKWIQAKREWNKLFQLKERNFKWLFNDINQIKQYCNVSNQASLKLNLLSWHFPTSIRISHI
jgi:hypothetical protein